MNITDMFKLAERTPKPLYWVEQPPFCRRCYNNRVQHDGDICAACQKEIEQGWEILTLTGRCANGSQRDSGIRYHKVMIGSYSAVCGAKPGRRSAGWSSYHGEAVTCPRCLRKMEAQIAEAAE